MLRSNLALIDQQRAYDTVPPSRRSLGADDARSAPLNPDELSPSSDSLLSTRNPVDDWKRLAALLLPANLEATVPAGTPIVIVPHGTIGLLPFAALTVGRDRFAATRRASTPAGARRTSSVQRVALETRSPLRYAPSFTALRASEARPRVAVAHGQRGAAGSVASSALLVGNPAMPFVYSGRWTTRSRLRSLPDAEAESQRIGTLLGVRTLTGKTATESAVRRRMVDAPLIHFATHGLGFGTAASARRSFVAFAPYSLQDGLLTLGELMDDRALALRADLVVLSACQTGLGNLTRAEGSIGLQRAFLAKGARTASSSAFGTLTTRRRDC